MIKAYFFENATLKELNPQQLQSRLSESIWIDLHTPTREEELFVESLLGIDVPTQEEMNGIMLSNRLYQRKKTLFTTILIVQQLEEEDPIAHAVTFILHNHILITVRYVDGSPYNTFLSKERNPTLEHPKGSTLFTYMIEDIIDRLSDSLEKAAFTIDSIHQDIFHLDPKKKGNTRRGNFEKLLSRIGNAKKVLSKTRESMFTVMRMLNFVVPTTHFKEASEIHSLQECVTDLTSLIEHENFLSEQVNFLLEITLGRISIEQNTIMKIVSLAAITVLPPTLVTGIFGMNFENTPCLDWYWGFYIWIGLMAILAYAPIKYFKYRGWL